MILIISQTYDVSTDKVINFLVNQGKSFVRINCDDIKYHKFKIDIQNRECLIDNNIITSIWYRKHFLKLKSTSENILFLINFNHFLYSLWYVKSYFDTVIGSPLFIKSFNRLNIENIICDVYKINSKSIITNDRHKIKIGYISKSIGDLQKAYKFKELKETTYHYLTQKIEESYEGRYFQLYEHKNYEIRCVIICGYFYCLLKLKLGAVQGTADWRIRENLKYQLISLDESEKQKILRILEKLELSYATIDIVIENRFRVVDVNPQGQFDDLDVLYFSSISKKIADLL